MGVSVTNCGSVVVKKVDNAATPNRLSNATFTIEKGKLVNGTENVIDSLVEGTGNKTGFYCIDNIKLDSGGSTHNGDGDSGADGLRQTDLRTTSRSR